MIFPSNNSVHLTLLQTIKRHQEVITALTITPSGDYLLSASGDKTLKIWKLDNGMELLTLEGHYNRVTGVVVTPEGRHAISASED